MLPGDIVDDRLHLQPLVGSGGPGTVFYALDVNRGTSDLLVYKTDVTSRLGRLADARAVLAETEAFEQQTGEQLAAQNACAYSIATAIPMQPNGTTCRDR